MLYGCLHNFSYDTQIEGTRAKYMYVLQIKFEDNYFEPKIIEKFLKPTMDSWLFEHYAEFLYCFAADGSDKTETEIYDKSSSTPGFSKTEYTLDEIIRICHEHDHRYISAVRIFVKSAAKENLLVPAESAEEEKDEQIKARLLTAFRVLERGPSDTVHRYAIQLLEEEIPIKSALCLLCHTYPEMRKRKMLTKL